jgi:hypothetical protein
MKRKRLSSIVEAGAAVLIGAWGNVGLSVLFQEGLHLSLFMDTLFTVGLTFAFGLVPGLLAGFFSNVFTNLARSLSPIQLLFSLCSMASAYTVWLFIRRFPGELALPLKDSRILPGRILVLSLLALALTALMSLLGGLTSWAIQLLQPATDIYDPSAETWFKLGLLRINMPLYLSEILSRLPVNIIDRLVAVFGGFGVALLYRHFRPGH